MRFAPPLSVHAGHPRHHGIAVQHLVHFLGAQHQVGAAIVRDQEAEAVGMPLHLALDEIQLVHHANRLLAVAHDLAVALHGAQAARKQLA
ncbi:MAG: hypothetical protein FD134_2005, partial [Gallionellaceae bacterium]